MDQPAKAEGAKKRKIPAFMAPKPKSPSAQPPGPRQHTTAHATAHTASAKPKPAAKRQRRIKPPQTQSSASAPGSEQSSMAEMMLGISDAALVKACKEILHKHGAGLSESSAALIDLSGHEFSGQAHNRSDGASAASNSASTSLPSTSRAQDKRMSYPAVYQPSLHYAGARTNATDSVSVSSSVARHPSNLAIMREAMQAPAASASASKSNDSIGQRQLPGQPVRHLQSQSSLLDTFLDDQPAATASVASAVGGLTKATDDMLQHPCSADQTDLHTHTQLPSQTLSPPKLPQSADQNLISADTTSQLQHSSSLLDAMLDEAPPPENQPATWRGQSQAAVHADLGPLFAQDTVTPPHSAPKNQASTIHSLLDDLLA